MATDSLLVRVRGILLRAGFVGSVHVAWNGTDPSILLDLKLHPNPRHYKTPIYSLHSHIYLYICLETPTSFWELVTDTAAELQVGRDQESCRIASGFRALDFESLLSFGAC